MILNLEQVRAIARGVAYVEETDGVFFFHRFTKSQEQAYLDGGNAGFCKRLSSTAGVRLAFVTDSSKFFFRYALKMAGSRPYGAFDVYENGILIKHFGFESGEWTCEGSQSVALSQGTKTVELYLPWSFGAALSEITLDDGAMLEGFSRKYTMISFGDSITQGVDVVHPSLAHACTPDGCRFAQQGHWRRSLFPRAVGGKRGFGSRFRHRCLRLERLEQVYV